MNNFSFAILDYYSLKTSDEEIRSREKRWKNVLMTYKNDYGYNYN